MDFVYTLYNRKIGDDVCRSIKRDRPNGWIAKDAGPVGVVDVAAERLNRTSKDRGSPYDGRTLNGEGATDDVIMELRAVRQGS